MQNNDIEYWGLKKLKLNINKMSNKNLLSIWNNIRFVNCYCFSKNYSKCSICANKKHCLHSVVYEEIVTEELIKRGLFDFAINMYSKKDIIKLPYSLIGTSDIIPKGNLN